MHIVCLTFDYDNTSSPIARGLTSPARLSRGEFGVVGAERILNLMQRHDIKTTWFVPGHTIESYPTAVKSVIDRGHEIGHHGWTHRGIAELGKEAEEAELVRGIESIRSATGRPPAGYRSPSWEFSDFTVELLLKHGFTYDSSQMGDDYLPYQARTGDNVTLDRPLVHGASTRLVEMPISWSLDDWAVFEFDEYAHGTQAGLMNAGLVLENWLNDFIYMKENLDWGILTFTFHPHIVGRGHRMIFLGRLIERLKESGAVFMTMEEAVQHFQKRFPSGRKLIP